jgi:perosamine synthetase
MGKKDFELNDTLIRLWSTYIPEAAGEAVKDILRSKWINTGIQEKLFRKKISEKFNIPYCVACTSGTAALRASYALLGIGPGDEVISTPYTFIATNTAILEQGAKPVFADVQYDTLNIDPQSVESKITKKTKAIVCVHYGGLPCDMDELWAIGKKYGLPVIEDSAHALGSKYKGSYIGSRGDIITFSLQAIKIITSGDGGIIATNNEEYYKILKKLVWFGIDRDEKKTNLLDPLPDRIDMLGFKYNMNDITATLGLVGIDNFEIPYKRRKTIGDKYRKELNDLRKIKLIEYALDRSPNYQIFPIHVENRLKFSTIMREKGIMVNVNNRRNDRYSIFGGICELPNTARAEDDVILIPVHADLTNNDVDRIIDAVQAYDKL